MNFLKNLLQGKETQNVKCNSNEVQNQYTAAVYKEGVVRSDCADPLTEIDQTNSQQCHSGNARAKDILGPEYSKQQVDLTDGDRNLCCNAQESSISLTCVTDVQILNDPRESSVPSEFPISPQKHSVDTEKDLQHSNEVSTCDKNLLANKSSSDEIFECDIDNQEVSQQLESTLNQLDHTSISSVATDIPISSTSVPVQSADCITSDDIISASVVSHYSANSEDVLKFENCDPEHCGLKAQASLHSLNTSDLKNNNTKELSKDNCEENCNYLALTFDDSKPLKPPPKFLSRKQQAKHKKSQKKKNDKQKQTKACKNTENVQLTELVKSLTSEVESVCNSEGSIEDTESVDTTGVSKHLAVSEYNSNAIFNLISTEVESFSQATASPCSVGSALSGQIYDNLNLTACDNSETSERNTELNNSPGDTVTSPEPEKVKKTESEYVNVCESSQQAESEVNEELNPELPCDNTKTSEAQTEDEKKHLNSCGTDDFDKLGDEAKRLAEELKQALNVEQSLVNSDKMEERDTKICENMLDEPCADSLVSSLNRNNECCRESRNHPEIEKLKISVRMDSHHLQLVNQSEAGPEIATGLTSRDLICASQFFKEAAELESQIRKNIAASSSSLNDIGCDHSENDGYCPNKDMHPGCPPHEERSAPEGTSSPDPRSLEDSEVRNRFHNADECPHTNRVNELLKKQALKFEEKLLRQGIIAVEKEKEFQELLKEEKSQMQELKSSRDALLKLVEQYKGMLAALVVDKEKSSSNSDEKLRALEAEKKQAVEDLANVEAAFSDVHRKYERTKQIVDSLRRNEETLKKAVAEYEEKLQLQEKKFVELQKHAEEKVKEANEEFEMLRRSNDQEMIKMGALLKKAEMKILSLQEALDRKTRENQELTQLCDDLISKVGTT